MTDDITPTLPVPPCPYCGGETCYSRFDPSRRFNNPWEVVCYRCGIRAPFKRTEQESLQVWGELRHALEVVRAAS